MSGPLALRARFREAFNENSHVREEKLNDIAYAAGGSRNWRGNRPWARGRANIWAKTAFRLWRWGSIARRNCRQISNCAGLM